MSVRIKDAYFEISGLSELFNEARNAEGIGALGSLGSWDTIKRLQASRRDSSGTRARDGSRSQVRIGLGKGALSDCPEGGLDDREVRERVRERSGRVNDFDDIGKFGRDGVLHGLDGLLASLGVGEGRESCSKKFVSLRNWDGE